MPDAPDELRAATYIVRRTALQIWQVSDSVTISTNTHPIRTLTWAVPTSWADAANGPMARVNICGIITPVNAVMTEHPGQLLHMDTIGPSQVRSMGGKWYVIIIVDDYSRYSWVFFLVSNDEVFEHFQLLTLRLNNEHPNCLKAIHSDNGTEFRNVSFDEFCLEHGIDQQFSAPRVP
jgi:transposase InsO family protein